MLEPKVFACCPAHGARSERSSAQYGTDSSMSHNGPCNYNIPFWSSSRPILRVRGPPPSTRTRHFDGQTCPADGTRLWRLREFLHSSYQSISLLCDWLPCALYSVELERYLSFRMWIAYQFMKWNHPIVFVILWAEIPFSMHVYWSCGRLLPEVCSKRASLRLWGLNIVLVTLRSKLNLY